MSNQTELTADILIVDDTPANLHLLSQMLTRQGYTVRAVTSGIRAKESIQLSRPDLILLDIKMPGMNGYEVCAWIKENPQLRDIPVIFISALDDIQDKVTAFHVGGVDYIIKPFQLEEVLARTQTHLQLSRLRRHLEEANRKMTKELELAARMQNNFMPIHLPRIDGWELSAVLQPARQTSGDFYDIFELSGGRYAILIADVVDKGVAAAMFMVLASSLLRTYARLYPASPSRVFQAVNERILQETDLQQYVTVFFAVLDPASGEMVYANAGHYLPILLSHQDGSLNKLGPHAAPLGIFPGQTWTDQRTYILPGHTLILYTDGILDAQNLDGDFFREDRFLNVLQSGLNLSLVQLQSRVLSKIAEFISPSNQYDDIALILLRH